MELNHVCTSSTLLETRQFIQCRIGVRFSTGVRALPKNNSQVNKNLT